MENIFFYYASSWYCLTYFFKNKRLTFLERITNNYLRKFCEPNVEVWFVSGHKEGL